MQSNLPSMQRAYPNNGLRSYWQHLRNGSTYKTGFWKTAHAFFQLSWQVLKDAGIELTFLFIFWIIITQMSQGRDLIVSLFEPDNIYTKWRIFWTVISAVSLSVAMWMVPAFIFQYRDRLNQKRSSYTSVFKQHLFFAHRFLPLIPFWLLASVLFNHPGTTILFILISGLQLGLLYLFHIKVRKQSIRRLYASGVALLLAIAIWYFNSIFEKTYTEAKVVLSVILYLVAFLLHYMFHEADFKIIREHQEENRKGFNLFWRYSGNSLLYIGILLLHVAVTWQLFRDYKLPLAPESMMLYIFSLYVFMIDLAIYAINLKPQGKFIVALAAILIVACFYYSPKINFNVSHYALDSHYDPEKGDTSMLRGAGRLTFEKRYEKLRDKIRANTSGEPYPIVLVSGEGGGSRAGFWLSQNLINFDFYTSGKFRDHIFSISTVSGSSVGLSTAFTFWDMTEGQPKIDSNWLEFPLEVYSNNFVGSSIKGLLLTDLWKSLIPWGRYETDRNSFLQDEESYYTQLAAQRVLKQAERGEEPDIATNQRILCRDFMNFFYDTAGGKLDFRDRPLVFINSCRSNDGRRGIISPIRLTDSVFNDAVDIAGYIYENSACDHSDKKSCDSHRRNISLGQACNLSELFPGFSAPAYIDSLGSFVDGGYHENSGLKTTLDVYTSLTDALERDGLQDDCEIYIMYFKNGSGEKNLYKGIKSELPITLPLKALTSQPFEGSASYFEEKARFVNRLNFFSIRLNNKLIKDTSGATTTEADAKKMKIEEQILNDLRTEPNDSTLKFPLARWLSKSVIKRMRLATFPVKVNPTDDDARVHYLLQKIVSFNDVAPVVLTPFHDWTPKADSLIRRQNVKKDFIDSAGKYRKSFKQAYKR
jgi:hypothetical protein